MRLRRPQLVLRLDQGLGLVVERLKARGAKDGLVQPLQAEEEQEDADQGPDEGQVGLQRDTEDGNHGRQHRNRYDGPGEGRSPAPDDAHGEDDGQRFDPLHPGGDEGHAGNDEVHLEESIEATRRAGPYAPPSWEVAAKRSERSSPRPPDTLFGRE